MRSVKLDTDFGSKTIATKDALSAVVFRFKKTANMKTKFEKNTCC